MQQVTERLEALVNEYTGKLKNLSDAEFESRTAPGKWSKKEILGHLVDSAQNNIQRFVRAQYEEVPHIVYQQDTWVKLQKYDHYKPEDLILLWNLLNRHIILVLNSMEKDMYGRKCLTTEKEQTIEFLANDYVDHHIHHLKQIFN